MTASASTPEEAANIVNAFGSETVKYRTQRLRPQLDRTIPFLRQQLGQLPLEERTADSGLPARIAALEALRALPDPTFRVVTPPPPPETPRAPRRRWPPACLLGGLVLGLGGAFGMQALDPRLRREEQHREVYRLPILVRVNWSRAASRAPRSARAALTGDVRGVPQCRSRLTAGDVEAAAT